MPVTFDDLDIDEAISSVRTNAVTVRPRDIGVEAESMQHVGLSLVVDSFEIVARNGGKKAIQKMALEEIMTGPWPAAALYLETIRGVVRKGGRSWEDLLQGLGFDVQEAERIIRVRNALVDMQMDPERFGYIPAAAIEPHLYALRTMKSRADRACFLKNLHR